MSDRSLDSAQYQALPVEWRERVNEWLRRHGYEYTEVSYYAELRPGLFGVEGYRRPSCEKWYAEVIDEMPPPMWADYVRFRYAA